MRNKKMKLSALAFAVQGALLTMYAMPVHAADDDALVALKTPTNYVEVGMDYTSGANAKFGEYNGRDKKKGNEAVINFDIRGGDAYGSLTGTRRMQLIGKDLGVTGNSLLSATVSDQGSWEIGVGIDQLQHNTVTGYQTPYIGQMGGNRFTPPNNLLGSTGLSVNANNNTGCFPAGYTGVAALTGTACLSAAQLATFNDVDVYNTRKNESVNAKVFLSPEIKVTFDYNHLKQGGAKLMAFASTGGIQYNGVPTFASASDKLPQGVAVLPNPTNYTTDTFNLGLHWGNENANISASYYASFFRDKYRSVSWDNFLSPTAGVVFPVPLASGVLSELNTITTMPDNDFHQLNLIGGYKFSKETKLTGGLSYARNTQNVAFVASELYNSAAGVAANAPVGTAPTNASAIASGVTDPMSRGSANAVVVTTHADLKLINQTTTDLKLAAGIKYDKRDNQTASNMYAFNAVNFGGNNGTNNPAYYPNMPLSNDKTQLELAADYRVNATQDVRVAYNREQVKRWCDQYAASVTALVNTVGYYPAGTNCVVATKQVEDKLGADYRAKASDDVSVRVGYSYADRKTTSDANAMPSIFTTNNNGKGPDGGNQQPARNAGDFNGFYPAFDASRKQQLLKGSVNWQAADELSVGANGRYTDDKYYGSDFTYRFGVQKGKSWSMSLDAAYAYSDSGSATPYITVQQRQRDMTSFQIYDTTAPAVPTVNNTWANQLKDKDTTLGLSIKQGDLMGGKLELKGDLSYSDAKTGFNTQYLTGDTVKYITPCSTAAVMSCGDTPDIKTKTTSLKLTGDYKLDKQSKIALGYLYQKLDSVDYNINGMQTGYVPNTILPTNQQTGSYNVNAVTAAYIYSFK